MYDYIRTLKACNGLVHVGQIGPCRRFRNLWLHCVDLIRRRVVKMRPGSILCSGGVYSLPHIMR